MNLGRSYVLNMGSEFLPGSHVRNEARKKQQAQRGIVLKEVTKQLSQVFSMMSSQHGYNSTGKVPLLSALRCGVEASGPLAPNKSMSRAYVCNF